MVAASLTVLLAIVLHTTLPDTAPAVRQRYSALLAAGVQMLSTERDLRRSALFQATLFGGFSAAWTALAQLITGPRYGLNAQVVGVLALIGAASMFCATAAGRWRTATARTG